MATTKNIIVNKGNVYAKQHAATLRKTQHGLNFRKQRSDAGKKRK
jgi:hypothetical protein